ncbi:hypothetical protein [Nocardioides immobilis]|nr:hypothetical protein [Nocardioides immobilis]
MTTHPTGADYRNQTVRIADLAVTKDLLHGLTFENCQLIGPAVIAPLGTTQMIRCSWDGDFDAFVWPIPAERTVIGAIGLADCTLIDCRMTRIGLVVPEDNLDQVKRGFGL